MPPKFAPKGRALFTHFHALAAVTVSIRLSYSRGKPCFGPPSRVHSHLPALPRSHRPRLARKAVPKRYSSRSPVSRLSDLRLLYHHKTRLSTPNFATPCRPPHSLPKKSMRRRGGDFPALFFQRGATRSRLPPRSAMDGRHWRPSPLCIPPQGEGLTCRFGRRRTLSTGELRPLATPLRGGAPVSAPASVGPGRCPPGTRTPLAPPVRARSARPGMISKRILNRNG